MIMRDYCRAFLMTVALAIVAMIIVACSNSHPKNQSMGEADSHFCSEYTMQTILQTDHTDERLRKLKENTYFQGVCP